MYSNKSMGSWVSSSYERSDAAVKVQRLQTLNGERASCIANKVLTEDYSDLDLLQGSKPSAGFVSLRNSICIARGYGLDGRCSIPGRATRFLSTPRSPTDSGVHLASYLMGTRVFPRR